MMQFGQWIRDVRDTVQHAKLEDKKVTVVVGNEASDADSIITALTLAYLVQKEDPDGQGKLVIPLVACNREDMMLRRETVLLLNMCGVDAKNILHLDDPETIELLKKVDELVLTDHNKATGPLAQLGDKVVMIIDHHQDLCAHEHVTGESRAIAFSGDKATAGSACSLIAERFLGSPCGKELLLQDEGAVARALMGVILIDTVNLDPAAKKVTPKDLDAVKNLQDMAPRFGLDSLFQQLDAAKFDQAFWAELSVAQCLRYDFKQFEAAGKTFGLSSVLCPLEELAAKDTWQEVLLQWASQADLYGVLSNTKSAEGGAPRRQLVILSHDNELTKKAADFMTKFEKPALELEALELPGPVGLKAFNQLNSGASRKQVAPCLSTFFGTL